MSTTDRGESSQDVAQRSTVGMPGGTAALRIGKAFALMRDAPMPEQSAMYHFSVSTPAGPGQDDVASLLRQVASTLEALGAVTVHDITFHVDATDDGPWPSMSVYYEVEAYTDDDLNGAGETEPVAAEQLPPVAVSAPADTTAIVDLTTAPFDVDAAAEEIAAEPRIEPEPEPEREPRPEPVSAAVRSPFERAHDDALPTATRPPVRTPAPAYSAFRPPGSTVSTDRPTLRRLRDLWRANGRRRDI